MVPLALGTQTNGSVIRPAAFCGVYGFKPTHGLISRHGILKTSRTLDCVGVFARSLDDIALLAEALCGYDERDPDTRPRARIPFARRARRGATDGADLRASSKTPMWERADAATREAFAELAEVLGERCEEVDLARIDPLPPGIGIAASWKPRWRPTSSSNGARAATACPSRCAQQLARGREVLALDYQQALARIPQLNDGFDELFQRYDAILTPAVPGTAPPLATHRRSGVLHAVDAVRHAGAEPAAAAFGPNGLPLGVQLVGRRGDDARLLRTRTLARRSAAIRLTRQHLEGPTMIVKYVSAAVALVLVFSYLGPVVFKLKDASLAGVMLIGVLMMLVDLWQSLKKPDA